MIIGTAGYHEHFEDFTVLIRRFWRRVGASTLPILLLLIFYIDLGFGRFSPILFTFLLGDVIALDLDQWVAVIIKLIVVKLRIASHVYWLALVELLVVPGVVLDLVCPVIPLMRLHQIYTPHLSSLIIVVSGEVLRVEDRCGDR